MTDKEREELIAAMNAFCERHGKAQSTLGRLAGNGGDFYSRLTSGGRMWPETAQKVWDYMKSYERKESA